MSSDQERRTEEALLCPKCLLANSHAVAFCSDCGAPLGMFTTLDPIQQIHAEGFAYRSAIDGPPKLIILIGMWLLFAPTVLFAPLLATQWSSETTPENVFYILMALGSAVILYRTTRNYVSKSRAAKELDAEL